MIADILRTKLESAIAECESKARSGVDKFYAEATYDGSRFRVPSFQAVGAVWLRLISETERALIAEIGRVLKAQNVHLNREGRATIQAMIEEVLSEGRYVERLKIFSEGIVRRAASFGIALDLSRYRFDIDDSAYRVGVTNVTRSALANVLAELKLQHQPTVPASVQSVVTWARFIRERPWIALTAIVFGGVAWLLSKINPADLLHWLRSQ